MNMRRVLFFVVLTLVVLWISACGTAPTPEYGVKPAGFSSR